MRIANKKLGKPDYEYTSVLKGKVIIVRLFHKPQYCVQIETALDKHCYPLTTEQYTNYCDNAEMILNPSREILKSQLNKAIQNVIKFDNEPKLKAFWENVRDYYARRFNNA